MTTDRNKLLEQLKRYDPAQGSSSGWDSVPPAVMEQSDDGDYVAYADVAALLQAQGEPQSSDQVWNGLTDNEKDVYVGKFIEYGTDFVAPIYAVVENIERDLKERNLKRPSQAQEQPAGALVTPDHDGAPCAECGATEPHICTASVSGAVDELTKALRFYADPERYRGSNNRLVGEDPYTPSGEVYLRDVMRDRGEIARAALSRAQATQPSQQAPAVSDDQILDAIDFHSGRRPDGTNAEALCQELRALLSQPAAAPVAEMVYFKRVGSNVEDSLPVAVGAAVQHVNSSLITRIVPLFAAPSNQSQGGDK
jgi:hypothetical protein